VKSAIQRDIRDAADYIRVQGFWPEEFRVGVTARGKPCVKVDIYSEGPRSDRRALPDGVHLTYCSTGEWIAMRVVEGGAVRCEDTDLEKALSGAGITWRPRR
jgi:hypothetical protein